jgi:F-type H+-transporting ATPase subunit alpha
MSLGKEVSIIYAVSNGFLDDVPVNKVIAFEAAFHRFMETTHPDIIQKIDKEKIISDEVDGALKKAITEFKETVPY